MIFMNPLDKAIQLCGGLSALAKAIDVSSARLGNWRLRSVPIEYCLAIETATVGEVSRKDLRPDDWHKIWPDLAVAAPTPRHATDPTPAPYQISREPSATNRTLGTTPDCAADLGAPP
jgi:DNA-binding transcriptional regulator YdaS (Cro superfamily)